MTSHPYPSREHRRIPTALLLAAALSIGLATGCSKSVQQLPSPAVSESVAPYVFAGTDSLPGDDEKIQFDSKMKIDSSGTLFSAGTVVPDFKLWSLDGKCFHLDNELAKGLPVILISGCYTCGIFRKHLGDINTLAKALEGKATIAIVYTIEAHPHAEPSPYPIRLTAGMPKDDVRSEISQARTMRERRKDAARLMASFPLRPTVLIDGPSNHWWSAFGSLPNSAFVIGKGRRILFAQAWFNDENQLFTQAFQYITGASPVEAPCGRGM